MLRKNFFSPQELEAIVIDFRNANLPPDEIAVMELAQKVVRSAHEITEEDIESLRAHGFAEAEIFDVILTAAARCFFGHTLDAAGAQPDSAYLDYVHDLKEILAVGRPFLVEE